MPDQNLPKLPEARRGHPFRLRLERCPQLRCFTGDPATGYELTLPLDRDGEIDALMLARDPARWRVRRFAAGQADLNGGFVRDPLGSWIVRYADDQQLRSDSFARSVRFHLHSIINVIEGREVWAYRIASIEPL